MTIEHVLSFWFGEARSAAAWREEWFAADAAFDAAVEGRFLDLYRDAAAGALDDWAGSARGCLALCIALDQFPRNMFRGTAQAFATDDAALAYAKGALVAEFDGEVSPVEKLFFYTPFMHSERIEDQRRMLVLYA